MRTIARHGLTNVADDDRRASPRQRAEGVGDRQSRRFVEHDEIEHRQRTPRDRLRGREHARRELREATTHHGHRATIEIGKGGHELVMVRTIEVRELGRPLDRGIGPREQRRAFPGERELAGLQDHRARSR